MLAYVLRVETYLASQPLNIAFFPIIPVHQARVGAQCDILANGVYARQAQLVGKQTILNAKWY